MCGKLKNSNMKTKEQILDELGFDYAKFKFDNEYSAKNILLAMEEYAKEMLEAYTQFLVKEGYCDTDVYSEPPTAIDQFLKIKPQDRQTLCDILKDALERVNHTLTLHGKVDANTPLHEYIIMVLEESSQNEKQ